jgi:hypothetical protein
MRSAAPSDDFDPRGVRFRRRDQPRGHVAVDLGKLILVDRRLASIVSHARALAQRPEHGENRHSGHQREYKPQRHQAGSGETTPSERSADGSLYTTWGKPGNWQLWLQIRLASRSRSRDNATRWLT